MTLNINIIKSDLLCKHTQTVKSLAFHHNNVLLVSGSKDYTVRLWRLDIRKSRVLEGHQKSPWFPFVNSVAFHPSKPILVSGSNDKSIKIWSIPDGKELKTLQGHTEGINAIAIHPHNDILASASQDKTVKLWSIESGLNIHTYEGHTNQVMSVAFSPNGELLASCGNGLDKTIRLWELSTDETRTIKLETEWFGGISALAFTPNSRILVSARDDKKIQLCSANDGKEIITLDGHLSKVTSIAISPNSLFLVSGSEDKTIKIWSLFDYQCIETRTHNSEVESVAISHDSKKIAVGLRNGSIQLYNL